MTLVTGNLGLNRGGFEHRFLLVCVFLVILTVDVTAGTTRPTRLKSLQLLEPVASRAEALSYLPDYGNGLERISKTHELLGRRVPALCSLADLSADGLDVRAVPLPEANTLFHVNYLAGRFGQVRDSNGRVRLFNPEIVLAKFKNSSRVVALRVEPGRELEAARKISERADVVFAELDMVQTRASASNDPLIANQWHHDVIHSFEAWDIGMGQSSVRVGIVDAPFQMDHPDLAANTAPGWDVVAGGPVVASAGIAHSTLCAGLVSAVLNNGIGVAGVGNCIIVPINITASTSDMCNAVYWAATNNVRVVNISWTGADSDALNDAGHFLKVNARGILVMSGENGIGQLDFPNQPDIWCISMTDAADNQRSKHGMAIDFAAPGWAMYSTTIDGGYGLDSGTSYSAPIFAGVCARLFSINPALSPDDVIDILKCTAVDLGEPGWDMWFGWGRIDFGAAAAMAASRLPKLTVQARSYQQVTFGTEPPPGFGCELWASSNMGTGSWNRVEDASIQTNGAEVTFTVPVSSAASQFFRVIFTPK